MDNIPKIIQELLENGISVTLDCYDRKKKRISYTITGFYKIGFITIKEYDGKLIVTKRYSDPVEINSVRDIVELNWKLWQMSKGKHVCWNDPQFEWIPLLKREGFI